MEYFLFGILIIFAGGIIAIFTREKFKGTAFLIFAVVLQFFILPSVFKVLIYGGQIESVLLFPEPIGTAYLRLDPLAAVFALIISLGALLFAIYSIEYMKMYSGKKAELSSYYFFSGLLITSMMFLIVAQNAILFLIIWEVMSVSSFFLVSFENNKPEVQKAGIYYLVAMQIGAAFLITAFAFTSASSGSLDFNSFRNVLNGSNGFSTLMFVFFFLGFGTKAGFVPLHTWLPRAHPAAPTGVSALMSGVMIKTGLYGILRIVLMFDSPGLGLSYGIVIISLLTAVYGIANAIAQQDLKKLLAYSSIENIGIIGLGIGIGMLGLSYNNPVIAVLGFLGAILHIINHFIFKFLLFFGAGIVYSKIHTRNIEKLGGLVKILPYTSYILLIGFLAISGMPLLNGFIGEFAIYLGMIEGFSVSNLMLNITFIVTFAGLAFIGVMAVLCFTKVYGICFLGSPRSEYSKNIQEESIWYKIPLMILTIFIIVIGLLPAIVLPLFYNVAQEFIRVDVSNEFEKILHIYRMISITTLGFIGMVAFFYSLRYLLLRNRKVTQYKTWDCGYQGQSSRFQYTGSSYAQPFLQLIAELVPQKIKLDKEKVLFPKEGFFRSDNQDLSERYIIGPLIIYINRFFSMFAWIQSGRMQQYILYGLIFLVLLLIWIFWV